MPRWQSEEMKISIHLPQVGIEPANCSVYRQRLSCDGFLYVWSVFYLMRFFILCCFDRFLIYIFWYLILRFILFYCWHKNYCNTIIRANKFWIQDCLNINTDKLKIIKHLGLLIFFMVWFNFLSLPLSLSLSL